MRKTLSAFGTVAAAALLVSACAGMRKTTKKETAAPGAAAKAGAPPTDAARTVDQEPDVRDMNLRAVPELKAVHFAYDSDRLGDADRAILKANAAFLSAHRDMKVQVSGHCDQRGTVAYNLALGQRRARSVRDYYKMLGVDPARVATISWGREHLLCSEANEDCWSRNRRSETLQALSAAVAGSPR